MVYSLWATILFPFVLFVFTAYYWASALYIEFLLVLLAVHYVSYPKLKYTFVQECEAITQMMNPLNKLKLANDQAKSIKNSKPH